MFGIFHKRFLILIPNRRSSALSNSISHLGFLQNPLFIVSSFSTSFPVQVDEQQKHNFTVSYLVNSCGFSLEMAKFVPRKYKLHFENSEKPDLVLNFLKNQEFSNAQISKILRQRPCLLLNDLEKTLSPKLEFLGSIGLSHSESAKLITSCPSLLERSLKNHLMPIYDFLKSVPIVDDKVAKTFKRMRWAILKDVQKNLSPNLALLREIGVPQSPVSLFLCYYTSAVFLKHSKFDKLVKEVKDLGFDPKKSAFAQAIYVLSSLKKANWEHRFEVYQRWGWSKDETLSAFRKHPGCMLLTEGRITKTMEFLVNEMGWPSKYISRNPVVLLFRLEKRIIPRCSVVRVLLSKGLIKKDLAPCTIIQPTEKYFLENYVTKFLQDIPQLLDVYQGKVNLLELGIGPEIMYGTKPLKHVDV